jgi:hypothetical protein
MQHVVENTDSIPALLPSWKPDPSEDLTVHIAGLQILTVSGRKLRLLLHNLDRWKAVVGVTVNTHEKGKTHRDEDMIMVYSGR